MPSPLTEDLSPWLSQRPAPGLFGESVRRDTLLLGGAALLMAAFSVAFADVPVAESVRDMPRWVRKAADTLTHLGRLEWVLVGAAIVAVVAAISRAKALLNWALLLLAAEAVAGVAVHLVKFAVGRPRPTLLFSDGLTWPAPFALGSDYSSMPSGHAATIACLAAVLWLRFPRSWPIWLAIAAVIALTRVFTLSHYLSDVFVGVWIGAAAALLIHLPFVNGGLLPRPDIKPV
ncbi:MAG: phosphatase PAP2 family protein [Planctomycetota bacterium]